MSWLSRIGTGVCALSCSVACGGEVDSSTIEPRVAEQRSAEPSSVDQGSARPSSVSPVDSPASPGTGLPASALPGSDELPEIDAPRASPPGTPSASAAVSTQASAACVALPVVAPRQPVLSYEAGCAVTELEAGPNGMSMAGQEDARALLVGRWQLCGEAAYYGGEVHEGIEFGSNGRNQLLRSSNGKLLPLLGGPRGVYYVLSSGQFMQRGQLSFGGYAGWASFDSTQSVLQLEAVEDPSAPRLRYVRVAPDEASAAANTFSTSDGRCSMVGVWDTAQSSRNPAATFAFNERGEWFGGEWGSDLCAAHSMYGTYNVETGSGPVQDNFDVPPTTELELVTNVGAGLCAFWFNAGFRATFGDDCNHVQLVTTWDNCTGGRGYLNQPGEELIRRVP